MKTKIHLLDCTLREAPIEGLQFGDYFIEKFISGLEKTEINVIEIGFLKNGNHVSGSTIFQRVEEMKLYIRRIKDVQYVALIDYGRYNIKNLSCYDGESIDGIRICFKKGEQNETITLAREIMNKGYQVYIQHVDTLGYSDEEIIDFIKKVNELHPYAYSIVDTFGAMYMDDVERVLEIVDKYLDHDILLGFHAHNNLMLAGANVQGFINYMAGKRNIIVDGSVYGCGRGAGNAHTELIMEFLNKKFNTQYNMDEILDLMDECLGVLKNMTSWGYSIPYLISGMYKSHVYNVDYLLARHNLKSKNLREIIEKLDEKERRIYDYPMLEKHYVEYFDHRKEDHQERKWIKNEIGDREVLLLAPGKSIVQYKDLITAYIETVNPYIIGVNNFIDNYQNDCVFFCSPRRFEEYKEQICNNKNVIVTSNISDEAANGCKCFDYFSLLRFGWTNIDNASVLLLRLLLQCGVSKISLAGVDGYNYESSNFYKNQSEVALSVKDIDNLNKEIEDMIKQLLNEYSYMQPELRFITPSIYHVK